MPTDPPVRAKRITKLNISKSRDVDVPQERVSAIAGGNAAGTDTSAAATWQRTLWAMVGIQFVMTAAFSMLSPIMPLFLPVLGVSSAGAVALWAGILRASKIEKPLVVAR